jgi:hypothetical protein
MTICRNRQRAGIVVREVSALVKYIKTKRRQRQDEKRKKMQRASHKMDALVKKLGNWNPQATIRKFRDTNLKGRS